MPTNPVNFLGLEPKYAAYDASRFAVLPIPYDATTSYLAGARHGPDAIIRASWHLEDFDEELLTNGYRQGISTLEAIEPNVDGPEAMHETIYKVARGVVRDGKFLFGLGGDHSVTSGLVRAVRQKHKSLSVLQIDAHCDLRNSFEGSRYSHATVMRRVHDLGVEQIVPVGIRTVAGEEHRFARKAGIYLISARECHLDEKWIARVLQGLSDEVYVTVDIDGFDPSMAPGTGTPEPGGLDWYQVIGLLRQVARERKIVAADIVEVMPVPGQVVTEFLAARLAYKIMSYVSVAG